jgi:hypothetical protein
VLRLTQFMRHLAKKLEVQREITAERRLQRLDVDAVQRCGGHRLDGVDVAAALGETDDVSRKPEGEHALRAVALRVERFQHPSRDDEDRVGRCPLMEHQCTGSNRSDGGNFGEVLALPFRQQLRGNALRPRPLERNSTQRRTQFSECHGVDERGNFQSIMTDANDAIFSGELRVAHGML